MTRSAAAIAAAVALSGCASIIKGGGPEPFTIRSQPPGAEVQLIDLGTNVVVAAGRTPFTAMLRKSAGFFQGAKYRVTVQLPGYAPHEALVDTRASGWYIAGNLFFGGLIGWIIVDPATGAMWTLSNDQMDVPLSPLAPPPTPPAQQAAPGQGADGWTSSLGGPCIGVRDLASVPPAARARMVAID